MMLDAAERATWVADLNAAVNGDTVQTYTRSRTPNNKGKYTYTDTPAATVAGRVGSMPSRQQNDAGQWVVVSETVVFADPAIVVNTDDLVEVIHIDDNPTLGFVRRFQVTGIDRKSLQVVVVLHVKDWRTNG